jgi:translation initiation factor IF-2
MMRSTAETGGFAGEQEAMVLQASLARPAKPRGRRCRRAEAHALPSASARRKPPASASAAAPWNCVPPARPRPRRPEMLVVPDGNLTVQELADSAGRRELRDHQEPVLQGHHRHRHPNPRSADDRDGVR